MNQEPASTAKRPKIPDDILEVLKQMETGLAVGASGISTRFPARLDELSVNSIPEAIDQILGPHHPRLAELLHWLAVLYHSRGDLAKAEFLYRRALDIAERTTKFSSESGLIMNNLGRAMQEQKKFEEAEVLYRRSLAILQQTLGVEHPRLATPLSNAASLSWEKGNRVEAELLYRHSLAILEDMFGPLHPKVIKARKKLDSCKATVRPATEL